MRCTYTTSLTRTRTLTHVHMDRFAPPLVITEHEIENAAGIIAESIYYFDKEHAKRKL